MKNKMSLVGMLVVVLTLGVVFTACENEPQEVKIVLTKANAVSKVMAINTSSATSSYYSYQATLSWDAVGDVSDYEVFVQEQEKKTIGELSVNITSSLTDIDKKTATVSLGSGTSSTPSLLGKSYRFGVRTTPLSSSVNTTYSDIVWSDYVSF